jgi:hypothetical protein
VSIGSVPSAAANEIGTRAPRRQLLCPGESVTLRPFYARPPVFPVLP